MDRSGSVQEQMEADEKERTFSSDDDDGDLHDDAVTTHLMYRFYQKM